MEDRHITTMIIRLTKKTDAQHILEYVRDDGTGESANLETKTFLTHDFLHYAIETSADLRESFYGLLNKGYSYAELGGKDEMAGAGVHREEAGITEMATGLLTGAIKGDIAPNDVMGAAENLFGSNGMSTPSWFTPSFIGTVKESMRKLLGHWAALRPGDTLTLEFPLKKKAPQD